LLGQCPHNSAFPDPALSPNQRFHCYSRPLFPSALRPSGTERKNPEAPSTMALKVLIAGGGIAGFSAAVALRRAGHVVYVYERSALNNEVGAAIHVPPNASRALLAWGLDPVGAKFVTVKSSFRAKAATLERFHVGTTESEIPLKAGAPWYFAHRVDLHEELKRLATEPTGPGTPATVVLKSEIVAYVGVLSIANCAANNRPDL
jgi:hypothetical protein